MRSGAAAAAQAHEVGVERVFDVHAQPFRCAGVLLQPSRQVAVDLDDIQAAHALQKSPGQGARTWANFHDAVFLPRVKWSRGFAL